ncbi:hypothetical protein N0V94_002197 [Neodidymelliopsis sp. IMI 364377]|nr:hypothetical protein N0V94_002197 [Neodidymelliopsis sp. IMI 364377]
MARQPTTNANETLRHQERASECITFSASELASNPPFEIFSDDQRLETPRRFASSQSTADYKDLNDENVNSGPVFKFVNKSTTKVKPVKRAPLTDVTQDAVSLPRSTSDLLARIASLEDALKLSNNKNAELKGEIVAYQDALNQADKDAGYF